MGFRNPPSPRLYTLSKVTMSPKTISGKFPVALNATTTMRTTRTTTTIVQQTLHIFSAHFPSPLSLLLLPPNCVQSFKDENHKHHEPANFRFPPSFPLKRTHALCAREDDRIYYGDRLCDKIDRGARHHLWNKWRTDGQTDQRWCRDFDLNLRIYRLFHSLSLE